MKLSDFDYGLPKELIAQEPLERRDDSRLLVLDGGRVTHHRFRDLPDYLRAGDVLVLNDSRVVPARVRGTRPTGGRLELLVLGARGNEAEALVRGKPPRAGERITFRGGECRVGERLAGSRYLLTFPSEIGPILDRCGEMPTPPYIKKRLDRPDRYQTVFAAGNGSVAAPTAGLHFTERILEDLRRRGVIISFVTLHIGPGTFQPIRVENIENHKMEPEYYIVPRETAHAVNCRKGRLVAVGTTVMKTIESASLQGARTTGGAVPDAVARDGGQLAEAEGWSDLFIFPGHEFRLRPDALLTNFHLPKSSLMLLVSAYAGRERIMAAYVAAVKEKYRFYSFGDAMLCLNQQPSGRNAGAEAR